MLKSLVKLISKFITCNFMKLNIKTFQKIMNSIKNYKEIITFERQNESLKEKEFKNFVQ